MVLNNKINKAWFFLIMLIFTACNVPKVALKQPDGNLPNAYKDQTDTTNIAQINWRDFFDDPNLQVLIDSALSRNQELNIVNQELAIVKNEIQVRKGEYLPFVNLNAGGGVEKVGRFTSQGANDANTEIMDGKEFPEPLGDVFVSVNLSWELDVWKKLRNAKKSTVLKYLSSVEGRHFMVTNLVSEVAHTYYELVALDNQYDILQQNINIQKDVLKIVQQRKQAGKVTELAVKRFEAEVFKNQSQLYEIIQSIKETENKLYFLTGSYPSGIARNSAGFIDLPIDTLSAGVPSQLLLNRPDIRQAEYNIEAAKLDIKVARANFYPSIGISSGVGFQAFNPKYLLTTPESMLYNLAGEALAPLINRSAIKAELKSANSEQIKAVYTYEQTILNAYVEVLNQVNQADNLMKSYDMRKKQVDALNESIRISNNLFKSARADYMEVLLTQREALEAKIDLLETKRAQISAKINLYHALGGGWK